MVDLNQTQAAIRAGYSAKTAYSIGNENLKKPDIVEYLNILRKRISESTEITPERVLQEYAKIAFFDIRKLHDDNGNLLPINKLDDESAHVVAGLEVIEFDSETKGFGVVKKIKLIDKKGALDSIAKHLGMFVEKVEHSGKVGLEVNDITELPDEELERIAANG